MEKRDIKRFRVLSEIQEYIQNEDDFLITTHVNPDGDSIASILAFASLLRHFGKRYLVLLDDPIPPKFDFLPGIDEIVRFEKQVYRFQPKVLVVLDASNLERIGGIRDVLPSDVRIINVDHHPSNEGFGSINAVFERESSTVEIVYEILSLYQVPISKDIATLIYMGIMCDTGRFRFPNTTHRSFQICSEMVQKGASPGEIARNLYDRVSQETVKLLATALGTVEFHFGGSVSCIHLSNGEFSKCDTLDTEGFVDYLMTVEGIEVGFFIMEKEPNFFRISFRSKSYIDVNQIALKFGGGGHKRAAGCGMRGTLDGVKARVLEVLSKYVHDGREA